MDRTERSVSASETIRPDSESICGHHSVLVFYMGLLFLRHDLMFTANTAQAAQRFAIKILVNYNWYSTDNAITLRENCSLFLSNGFVKYFTTNRLIAGFNVANIRE